MIEQRLLVLEQPVVAAIQLVDLGQPDSPRPADRPCALRSNHSRCRRHSLPGANQPIGDQHQQHLIPARALAARPAAARPRTDRAPAPATAVSASQHAPHCRGRRSRSSRQLQPDDRGVRQQPLAAILRETATACAAAPRRPPNTSIDLRHASSCESLISPRYSTCRCTTRPPPTRLFSTTLQ